MNLEPMRQTSVFPADILDAMPAAFWGLPPSPEAAHFCTWEFSVTAGVHSAQPMSDRIAGDRGWMAPGLQGSPAAEHQLCTVVPCRAVTFPVSPGILPPPPRTWPHLILPQSLPLGDQKEDRATRHHQRQAKPCLMATHTQSSPNLPSPRQGTVYSQGR